MPKVSIIVPNYNHAPFLEQRLESILFQTFQDYELILLDDCSTDGSLDIIHRYKNKCPQIRVFLNDRNSGSPFKQWDFGVRQAGGDYIWVAESDDGAAANFLDEMVPILEKNSHIGLAHCDALIINDKGQSMASLSDNYSSSEERKTTDYINNGKAEIENRLCVSNTINNASGVIFRKTSYINAGFSDFGMRYCGDWFLYLRMLLATDIGYKASPLNLFRIHAGSSFHRYYADNHYLEEVMRIYHFVMQHLSVPPTAKKKIYGEISRHFCVALKRGFIPSKQVVYSMREMVPFFELCVLKFIRDLIMKKYVRGLLP
ncbi:MAG: glycosyltransferase [Verrucomicrobia bacterium]|nr:glycosyltransferase [Verrucomicrobiota bacterium]MBU1734231.1 glycosyltransferase [Verrucomicrobiota bacterium]MBU1855769.1 glycosyltransferase [Verrucomicrobiota bacterium]